MLILVVKPIKLYKLITGIATISIVYNTGYLIIYKIKVFIVYVISLYTCYLFYRSLLSLYTLLSVMWLIHNLKMLIPSRTTPRVPCPLFKHPTPIASRYMGTSIILMAFLTLLPNLIAISFVIPFPI